MERPVTRCKHSHPVACISISNTVYNDMANRVTLPSAPPFCQISHSPNTMVAIPVCYCPLALPRPKSRRACLYIKKPSWLQADTLATPLSLINATQRTHQKAHAKQSRSTLPCPWFYGPPQRSPRPTHTVPMYTQLYQPIHQLQVRQVNTSNNFTPVFHPSSPSRNC